MGQTPGHLEVDTPWATHCPVIVYMRQTHDGAVSVAFKRWNNLTLLIAHCYLRHFHLNNFPKLQRTELQRYFVA